MVAIAPNSQIAWDEDAIPLGETMVKLADAPNIVPFCMKTIRKRVREGAIRTWFWGVSEVTTKEELYRAARRRDVPEVAAEPKQRRKPSPRAVDSVGRFLAMK